MQNEQCCKKVLSNLATILSVLHNNFNDPTVFSDMYLTKLQIF